MSKVFLAALLFLVQVGVGYLGFRGGGGVGVVAQLGI